MVKTGKVVSAEKGHLQVCFERPEACAKCGQCGTFSETLVRLDGTASPGDTVEVYFPEGQLIRFTAVAYVVPLAFFLSGLLIGKLLFGSETGEIILALVFGAFSAAAVVLYDRRVRRREGVLPRIIRVIPSRKAETES